jgi:hypothetical protein
MLAKSHAISTLGSLRAGGRYKDGMPGRAFDLIEIPDSFWQRAEVISALRSRQIGQFFELLHQCTKASQTQIGIACGLNQGKVSEIMRRLTQVEKLEVFERIADGLAMPDSARIILGLAPLATPYPVIPARRAISSKDTRSAILTVPALSEEDAVAAAADEASADRLKLALEPDPESVGWLRTESVDIARAANRSALDTFMAARRVRSYALKLAEQTHRPGLLSELIAICGQMTALMASGAFDLNRWNESDALAKSAASYANLIGHASLQAWVHGLGALLANWRGEPDIALGHFQRGLQIAPPGTPRVRLRYIASRSYALLGDSASVSEVLTSARSDQGDADKHVDSLSTEIGGEFAFGHARAEACAAAAWLDLSHGREALAAAQSALDALTSVPLPRRPQSQVNGVRIDMATACLLTNDLDGGAEALKPVLAQPASLRNASLAGRLARTRTALLSPTWAKKVQARQLADEIGKWLTTDQEHRHTDIGQF